ncbi:hypothetical protein WKK05_38470 (plasmid) [Nostoc sp. UHCC 0302]|uniref:hypothetical protein n=1 Tax=Nostoc sp. UHCC 0302 TaxID=3134896 RepID=UPI00311CD131
MQVSLFSVWQWADYLSRMNGMSSYEIKYRELGTRILNILKSISNFKESIEVKQVPTAFFSSSDDIYEWLLSLEPTLLEFRLTQSQVTP